MCCCVSAVDFLVIVAQHVIELSDGLPIHCFACKLTDKDGMGIKNDTIRWLRVQMKRGPVDSAQRCRYSWSCFPIRKNLLFEQIWISSFLDPQVQQFWRTWSSDICCFMFFFSVKKEPSLLLTFLFFVALKKLSSNQVQSIFPRMHSTTFMQARCDEPLTASDCCLPLLLALLTLALLYSFLYLPATAQRALLEQALNSNNTTALLHKWLEWTDKCRQTSYTISHCVYIPSLFCSCSVFFMLWWTLACLEKFLVFLKWQLVRKSLTLLV